MKAASPKSGQQQASIMHEKMIGSTYDGTRCTMTAGCWCPPSPLIITTCCCCGFPFPYCGRYAVGDRMYPYDSSCGDCPAAGEYCWAGCWYYVNGTSSCSMFIWIALEKLRSSGYGLHIGSLFVGCILYVDDIVLLSPSCFGLQKLLNHYEQFASNCDTKFNTYIQYTDKTHTVANCIWTVYFYYGLKRSNKPI